MDTDPLPPLAAATIVKRYYKADIHRSHTPLSRKLWVWGAIDVETYRTGRQIDGCTKATIQRAPSLSYSPTHGRSLKVQHHTQTSSGATIPHAQSRSQMEPQKREPRFVELLLVCRPSGRPGFSSRPMP